MVVGIICRFIKNRDRTEHFKVSIGKRGYQNCETLTQPTGLLTASLSRTDPNEMG